MIAACNCQCCRRQSLSFPSGNILSSSSGRSPSDATPESIQRNAETVLAQQIRINNLEAMIMGMTEAMRPMLEEWKRLTAK